jgi:hypothetical protein
MTTGMRPFSAWVKWLESELSHVDVPQKTEPDEHGRYFDLSECFDWLNNPRAKLMAARERLIALSDKLPDWAPDLRAAAKEMNKLAAIVTVNDLLTHDQFMELVEELAVAHQLLRECTRLRRKP